MLWSTSRLPTNPTTLLTLSALPIVLLHTFVVASGTGVSSSSSSSSQIAAYSSGAHFACALTADDRGCTSIDAKTVLQSSLLPSLLHYMSSDDAQGRSRSQANLFPAMVASSSSVRSTPALTLLVHSISALSDPVSSLISRAAATIPSKTASAFHVLSDQPILHSTLINLPSEQEPCKHLSSLPEFEHLVSDNANPLPKLVSVPAPTQKDVDRLFDALYTAAQRTQNNIAVIFSVHQTAADDQPAGNNPASDPAAAPADAPPADATTGDMLAPDITEPQLTGLLVAVLFLAIFVPGFLCLWRIQTPQTFAILDSNDMKKKLQ